ncbi:hypothetical protein HJG60_008126 [Phyllostomus discolor]|uniref:Uncharacterized protein n=1 Tax=Phyllostomus discolor TaxID=89673 RepID=A0A834DLV1_9CHIR|nr:hypothetical protein HJG60_008126 [Phyllostomus discolor]
MAASALAFPPPFRHGPGGACGSLCEAHGVAHRRGHVGPAGPQARARRERAVCRAANVMQREHRLPGFDAPPTPETQGHEHKPASAPPGWQEDNLPCTRQITYEMSAVLMVANNHPRGWYKKVRSAWGALIGNRSAWQWQV